MRSRWGRSFAAQACLSTNFASFCKPIDMPKKILLLVLTLAILPSYAHAQLPLIRLDRITPLGGLAGSEVTLDIAGRDLEEAKTLHFDHPGLKATWLKDRQFKIA